MNFFDMIGVLAGWTFPEVLAHYCRELDLEDDSISSARPATPRPTRDHIPSKHEIPKPIPFEFGGEVLCGTSGGRLVGIPYYRKAQPHRAPFFERFDKYTKQFADAKNLSADAVQRVAENVQEYAPKNFGDPVPSLKFVGVRPDVASLQRQRSTKESGVTRSPRVPTNKWQIGAVQFYRADGQAYVNEQDPGDTRKCNSMGSNAMIIVGTVEEFKKAKNVWKCEGLTDALMLAGRLPKKHVAVTFTGGANAVCHELCWAFVGKTLYVVGDADDPGQCGMVRSAFYSFHYARAVYLVKLPYEIGPKHGKDLRDYLTENQTSKYYWAEDHPERWRGHVPLPEVERLMTKCATRYTKNDYQKGVPTMPRRQKGITDDTNIDNSEIGVVHISPSHSEPRITYGFVVGESDAKAVEECGLACIGLSNVWSWRRTDGGGDGLELIDELAAINWRNRTVWIAAARGRRRDPEANHAWAELARVLTHLGATVVFVDLPLGPPGDDRLPTENGPAEFIARHGESAFREVVRRRFMHRKAENVSLEQHRAEMLRNRKLAAKRMGVHFDGSPTGTGESYADMQQASKHSTSLTLERTHLQCEQREEEFARLGVNAVAYPVLSEETCGNFEEAERAMEHGLSVRYAVCPGCPLKKDCTYLAAAKLAKESNHTIATHQRAAFSLEQLSEDKRYLSLQEDASSVVRAVVQATGDFTAVADLASAILDTDEKSAKSPWLRGPLRWMRENALGFNKLLSGAKTNAARRLPAIWGVEQPFPIDEMLLKAMKVHDIWPHGPALRLVMGVVNGSIRDIAVIVPDARQSSNVG